MAATGQRGSTRIRFLWRLRRLPVSPAKMLGTLDTGLDDDLWKHSFHNELEQFVVSVRDLIVPMFDDVERFGLKTMNLRKHKKRVDRFYKHTIEGRQTESDLAEKYNKRFRRYREELFTFLLNDGIPWNNNTACDSLSGDPAKNLGFILQKRRTSVSSFAGNRSDESFPEEVVSAISVIP